MAAKIELISASASSLNLKSSQSAPHVSSLLKIYDPAPQITPKSEPAM